MFFVEPAYVTNEVKGSFFRPHDYMAKVPGAHVIAKASDATKEAMDAAVEVYFSKEGLKKYQEGRGERVFASEDGVVRKVSFGMAADDTSKVNITA